MRNILLAVLFVTITTWASIYAEENGQWKGMDQKGQMMGQGMGGQGGNWPHPEDGYSMNQSVQPTGGSKMLPPFGNKGSGPNNQIQFNPPPGMKMDNGGKMMEGSGMMNGSGMQNMMKKPMMDSGAMAEKQAREIPLRKSVVEYLTSLGADTSVFTETVIMDGAQFWKALSEFSDYKEQLAKYMAELRKSTNGSGMMMPPPMGDDKNMMSSSGMRDGTGMMMSDEKKSEKSGQKAERPALTEKAKKALQDRLDKIASDKRDATLAKMLKNAQKQLATAEEKGNKLLIRKLTAIIEIIQDEIDSGDDTSLLDSLTQD